VIAAVASWPQGSAALLTQQQTGDIPWGKVLLTQLAAPPPGTGPAVTSAGEAGGQPGSKGPSTGPLPLLGQPPPPSLQPQQQQAPQGAARTDICLKRASLACLVAMAQAQPGYRLGELATADVSTSGGGGGGSGAGGGGGLLGCLVSWMLGWQEEVLTAAAPQAVQLAYSLALSLPVEEVQQSGLVKLLQVSSWAAKGRAGRWRAARGAPRRGPGAAAAGGLNEAAEGRGSGEQLCLGQQSGGIRRLIGLLTPPCPAPAQLQVMAKLPLDQAASTQLARAILALPAPLFVAPARPPLPSPAPTPPPDPMPTNLFAWDALGRPAVEDGCTLVQCS